MSFTPFPFAPGSYQPVLGNNFLTFVGSPNTAYTVQWGRVTGVQQDGSSIVQVPFNLVFPNAVASLIIAIDSSTLAPTGSSLAYEANSVTTAGFNAVVTGGPAGSTPVALNWMAWGY